METHKGSYDNLLVGMGELFNPEAHAGLSCDQINGPVSPDYNEGNLGGPGEGPFTQLTGSKADDISPFKMESTIHSLGLTHIRQDAMGEDGGCMKNLKQKLSKRAQKKLELSPLSSFLAKMESPKADGGMNQTYLIENQENQRRLITCTALCEANKTWELGKSLGLVYDGNENDMIECIVNLGRDGQRAVGDDRGVNEGINQ